MKNSYYGGSSLSREATWTKDCYNILIGIHHLALPNYDWPVYTDCKDHTLLVCFIATIRFILLFHFA